MLNTLNTSKRVVSVFLSIIIMFTMFVTQTFAVSAANNYVVDAKNECYYYTDEGGNERTTIFRVPKILLDSNDARVVNREILIDYQEKFENATLLATMNSWVLSYTKLDYNYYVYGDVLSVLIYYKYPHNNYTTYSIYNFEISTGNLLDNNELTDKLSLDYSNIKNTIINEIEEYFSQFGNVANQSYVFQQYQKSVAEENINFAKLYIGDDNQLMAMYRIYTLAGAEEYYWLMPVEKLKDYYFKLKEDTNQFVHSSTSYYLDNERYRKRLYLDSLLTWDSTFRIYDEIYSGDVGGVCHGIALSMCYAKNGNLDLKTLNNGKQTNNYWGLGSLYDSDKSKFKDLVTYYQLTQLTANGAESYSVSKNGWHIKSLNERLTDFLRKFKQEAERSEREKKPFVFSFCYKLNGEVKGHSVVACGYNYNSNTNEHEILIYDENTYPNVRYSTFKISSDYSSFTFTDSNGENSGYMISDIWTNLEVYDIDKLYGGNSNSITVVNGRQIVSANNTTSINITAYKKFKLINDKGEYLEYDGNNYKGNMNVYDCKLVDNLDGTSSWKIEVPNSSKFEFLDTEDDIEIIGENYVGGFYIQTDSTDKLVVDGGNITVDGDRYNLDVALQTEGTKDFIRIQGKAGGNTVVSNENDKINAQSNKYLSAVNVVSYGSDTVNEEKVDNVVSSITIENNSGEVVNENILPYIFGDANSDGLVNAKDRMYLTRHLAKWNGYETIDECSSDVNGDGIVNAKDRMILTRYLAKWKDYTTLPYNK